MVICTLHVIVEDDDRKLYLSIFHYNNHPLQKHGCYYYYY